MTHRQWEDLLGEFLDGSLSAERRGEVETHLAGCVDCSRMAESLASTLRMLHSFPTLDVPLGFTEGVLQRTTGPAFSAVPFNPNLVVRNTVGDATFTFTDLNTGTFRYTVNGITQTKPIKRLGYGAPVTVCR